GYEYLGEQTVKNIAKPVGAYRVLMEPRVTVAGEKEKAKLVPLWRRKSILAGGVAFVVLVIAAVIWNFYFRPPPMEVASKERMAFPLPEKPSIAVLPFTNLSGDKDQEYFADGITEDIVTDLSKVSGLFVVARNSTFIYKGRAVKVREIAEALGVRNILAGSVRRSGDRMRINVQLIDALKGSHLWAERYDRERKDLFSVSDDVAHRVVSELAVTLKVSEQERLFRRHTENLEAYETFLHARRVLTATKEATLQAKKLFERVMELDPRFAGGYAGLSLVLSRLVRHGFSASPEEDNERSLKLAQRAVAIDDTFGWSYLALASAYLNKREHDKAIATLEEWIRIQPGSADAYRSLGFNLHWAGRGDEAIDSVKKSIRLDPGYERFILGMAYFTAGRYEDAIATINQKYADCARKGHLILCFLAASYAAIGHDEKAREVTKVFLKKHPRFTLSSYPHLRLYKRTEDRDRYANLLRRAGMPEK
ncbi:MAG: tetratricopeptide repeat protein, partial [Deltaproteobacteria bacterium]